MSWPVCPGAGFLLLPKGLLVQARQRVAGWPGLELSLLLGHPLAPGRILLGEDSGPERALLMGARLPDGVGTQSLAFQPGTCSRASGDLSRAAWEGPCVPDHRHWA